MVFAKISLIAGADGSQLQCLQWGFFFFFCSDIYFAGPRWFSVSCFSAVICVVFAAVDPPAVCAAPPACRAFCEWRLAVL